MGEKMLRPARNFLMVPPALNQLCLFSCWALRNSLLRCFHCCEVNVLRILRRWRVASDEERIQRRYLQQFYASENIYESNFFAFCNYLPTSILPHKIIYNRSAPPTEVLWKWSVPWRKKLAVLLFQAWNTRRIYLNLSYHLPRGDRWNRVNFAVTWL